MTSSRPESSQSLSSVSIFSLFCISSDVSCISYKDLASIVGDTIKKQLQDIKDKQVCFTLFLAFLLLTICINQVCYSFFAEDNVWRVSSS